jgi:hypothetical protein
VFSEDDSKSSDEGSSRKRKHPRAQPSLKKFDEEHLVRDTRSPLDPPSSPKLIHSGGKEYFINSWVELMLNCEHSLDDRLCSTFSDFVDSSSMPEIIESAHC